MEIVGSEPCWSFSSSGEIKLSGRRVQEVWLSGYGDEWFADSMLLGTLLVGVEVT